MKVLELVELLERVQDAKDEVAEAARSLEHGGSPETMERKRANLKWHMQGLEDILNENVVG